MRFFRDHGLIACLLAALLIGSAGLVWHLSLTLCSALALAGALAVYAWQCQTQAAQSAQATAQAQQERLSVQTLADNANRDKSKFLGMLSHELLTPLQTVMSSMDMIESKGHIDRTDPIFLRLREGVRALHARTSDLVDFAKMTAGHLAVSHRKFRVDRLIEDVLAEHEEIAVFKDLGLDWEPDETLSQPIVTDPRRVRQILDNLISNALKYTQRGGVLIEAHLNLASHELMIEVKDTGVGIAHESLNHIFEPFYRVASSAQLAQGSGLGLAVVKSLVDLLGGQIKIDSTLGQGTAFSVTIPFTLLTPKTPTNPGTNLPPSTTAPILIVDDAHDARTALAHIVRTLGYEPNQAGSAQEALRVLSEQKYAAVLLDIELAGSSGFDVIKSVRQGTGPNRDSYFVMMSASYEPHPAEYLFNARTDKPVDQARLAAVLKKGGQP